MRFIHLLHKYNWRRVTDTIHTSTWLHMIVHCVLCGPRNYWAEVKWPQNEMFFKQTFRFVTLFNMLKFVIPSFATTMRSSSVEFDKHLQLIFATINVTLRTSPTPGKLTKQRNWQVGLLRLVSLKNYVIIPLFLKLWRNCWDELVWLKKQPSVF